MEEHHIFATIQELVDWEMSRLSPDAKALLEDMTARDERPGARPPSSCTTTGSRVSLGVDRDAIRAAMGQLVDAVFVVRRFNWDRRLPEYEVHPDTV